MKVTKYTGAIGGIIIGITTILFLAYWVVLLEPLQLAILEGRVSVSRGKMYLIASLVAVLLNTSWLTGTKMIGGRQFDMEYIDFKGAFKSKAYWQMAAVTVFIFVLFTHFWYNQL